MSAKPEPMLSVGHFYLWFIEDDAAAKEGPYRIFDQRCPRAHAHTVWSGRHVESAVRAVHALAENPPPFLPCEPGVTSI
jgi:hypothetical protein